ncbi:MAG: T9SS type A sorting domain-containing protein [Haliscomenobacter sp.]|nr:T9SS type A sorting domain-containing protein [Haliscomenobacter sp.]MBK9492115.1 T9SS type A sorting domain-containing protein [Haliscomenobacter sp.]
MKKYQPESKLILYRRGNFSTLIDSVAIYIWNEDSNNWEKTLLQTNSYNAQNRLARELSEITVEGLKYQSMVTYTYNEAGKNTLIEEVNLFFGIVSPVSRTAMTYNPEGKLKEVMVSLYLRGEFVLSEREVFAYKPGAYKQDTYLRDETTGVWNKTQSLLYKLDVWNRTASLEKTFMGFDGNPEARELTVYGYVVNGDQPNYQHLTMEQIYQWDKATGAYNLSDRKFYHYRGISTDLPDLEVKAKSLLIFPNPAQDKIQLSLEEDAQVWVYNVLGQQLLSRRLGAGQSLDVMQLSRGVYYVVAQHERICTR